MTCKVTCFICGYKTLDSRCDWDICPVCFWEDDVLIQGDDDPKSPANGLFVSEAQANFMRFGAVDKNAVDKVRKPLADEERDESWSPLKRALELGKERNGGG